jgi:putative ABC transport system substrate-binding protein
MAQQAAKIPSVGILRHGTSDKTVGSIGVLRQGLRELGYVEGQTITLEYRFSGGKAETMPALAADLVRLRVDVLFAGGVPAISAAIGASRTIPIVGVDLEVDPSRKVLLRATRDPAATSRACLWISLP